MNLDAALQEAKLGALPPLPDVSRFRAPEPTRPAPELIAARGRAALAARRRP